MKDKTRPEYPAGTINHCFAGWETNKTKKARQACHFRINCSGFGNALPCSTTDKTLTRLSSDHYFAFCLAVSSPNL